MHTPELLKKHKRPLLIVGGAAGAVILAGTIATTIELTDPEATFVRDFTNDGKCLDETPFDPDTGAIIHVDEIAGSDVLSVMPRAANAYSPSVLFFVIESNGVFESPNFVFADSATGSFAVNANCPNQPNGY